MSRPLAGRVALVAGATRGGGRGTAVALCEAGGSLSSGGLAREYGFTDVDGSQPDCFRYMAEVMDPGLPPDPAGYR